MTNDLTLAICMYNAEKYIEETLQCIMTQTMQDFHLLIVNDCSTDNSVQIVEDFFKRNLRQYELVNLPQNGRFVCRTQIRGGICDNKISLIRGCR